MAGILNIQINPVIGNKEKNLEKIECFVEDNKNKKLDLVVVPEFFSTGVDKNSFVNSPEDEEGGVVIKKMCELAKKYNTNIIAGSIIEKSAEKLYNTSYAINREGKILEKYRKIHLFNYMGGTEGDYITPGDKIKVVDFDFARIGLSICFDLRYPLLFKELSKKNAQIIVLPTAWVVLSEIYKDEKALGFAKDTFNSLVKVRSYDNGVYFVVSNICGEINNKIASFGSSCIVSPMSEILKQAKNEECAIYCDIDISLVDYYRKIYPIAQID